MEYTKHLECMVLFLLLTIAFILICYGYVSLKCSVSEQEKEIFKKSLSEQNEYVQLLEIQLMNKDRRLKTAEGTIKFLGEQNIILHDRAGNIPVTFKSETLKNEAYKKAINKFVEVLQTSKEV